MSCSLAGANSRLTCQSYLSLEGQRSCPVHVAAAREPLTGSRRAPAQPMSDRAPSGPETAPLTAVASRSLARGRMLSRSGSRADRSSNSPVRRNVILQGSQGSSFLADRELAPYQRHQRLLGWKLTSLERRKETLRLLESGVLGHGAKRHNRPATSASDVRALVVGFALDLETPFSELTLHDSVYSSQSVVRRGNAAAERSPSR